MKESNDPAMNQKKESAKASIAEETSSDQSNANRNYTILKILQDSLSFELFIILLCYNELSLGDLTQKIQRSKSTVFRHVQKLLEAGFIYESREEKVRGDKLAKYYRPKWDNFSPKMAITPDLMRKLSNSQLIDLYHEITHSTNATIQFIKSLLDELQRYLETKPNSQIPKYIFTPDISLSMNLFSESLFQKWQDGYRKFVMDFFQQNQAELVNPNVQRPYCLVSGILPIKRILDEKPKNEPSE